MNPYIKMIDPNVFVMSDNNIVIAQFNNLKDARELVEKIKLSDKLKARHEQMMDVWVRMFTSFATKQTLEDAARKSDLAIAQYIKRNADTTYFAEPKDLAKLVSPTNPLFFTEEPQMEKYQAKEILDQAENEEEALEKAKTQALTIVRKSVKQNNWATWERSTTCHMEDGSVLVKFQSTNGVVTTYTLKEDYSK